MRKLFDNVVPKYSLDAEVYTTDTVATDYVDTQGFGDGMLVAFAGDIATTTGDSYTLTVMECETTNGTYTTTGISVTFDDTEDNEIKSARISDLGTTRMRYLKVDLTMTGTTLSFEGGAMILLGEPASGPVTQNS